MVAMIPKSRSPSHLGASRGVFTIAGVLIGILIGTFFNSSSNVNDQYLQVLTTVQSNTAASNTRNEPPSSLSQRATTVEESSAASGQRNFLEIASRTGTDKVRGTLSLQQCLDNPASCRKPKAINPKCRVGAQHFYDSMYQKWLGPWSTDETPEFQFLEIGYYNGFGFDAYTEFLPRAEKHSMEISCLPQGERKDGKWPWGNFAEKNKHYSSLLNAHRLHCGDASEYRFLHDTWTTHLQRPDAPPLKVVIDDGAHLAHHMATTLFFWFPRLAPGGILVIEDVEPLGPANQFRTGVLPQVLFDLHYCGDEEFKETACFPTIRPLLHAVHCEMHICVFERNDQPAVEPNEQDSMPPPHALDATKCLTQTL